MDNVIDCKCGCGSKLNYLDNYDRPRVYIRGHNSKEADFRRRASERLKGKTPWNKNKKNIYSEESLKRMSLAHIGQKSWNKGIPNYKIRGDNHPTKRIEVRRKISLARMGHKVSKETREKIRKKLLGRFVGEKNPAWLGGKSFEPYSPEFNDVLKRKIRKLYDYTCQLCTEKILKQTRRKFLTLHHIDYNKKNNTENNLIALCNFCNSSVNTKRKEWIPFFQEKVIE